MFSLETIVLFSKWIGPRQGFEKHREIATKNNFIEFFVLKSSFIALSFTKIVHVSGQTMFSIQSKKLETLV